MPTLFDDSDRNAIFLRLEQLQPASQRQWGKMGPAQMLAHCALPLEMTNGDEPVRQKLIGVILAPLVRRAALGDKPFGKNAPTDPTYIVSDERDFAKERERLRAAVERFRERGPQHAATRAHVFFGKLSGDEWGLLMYKHLDHHLRQFGL
jgi:hypothetical protein